MNDEKPKSKIVEHARVELELLNTDKDELEGYLRVIQAFADMGHSGGSAMVAIPVIHKLLLQENLKPLTDDPDEWDYHNPRTFGVKDDLWQNKRNSKAFSIDAGKTYWLVDETTKTPYGKVKKVMHTSEKSERIPQ